MDEIARRDNRLNSIGDRDYATEAATAAGDDIERTANAPSGRVLK